MSTTADRTSFGNLLEAHGPAILSTLRHLCRDDNDADDIFQETALRVWRNLGSKPLLRNPRGWLMTIAYHCFVDHRRGAVQPEPLGELADGKAGDPAVLALEAESVDRVRAFTAALPEKLRGVVALHYAGGLSLRQAARALGISAGTAKSRLNAALEHLRKVQP